MEWSRDKLKARRYEIKNLIAKLEDLQMEWEENIKQIKDTSEMVNKLDVQEEQYW